MKIFVASFPFGPLVREATRSSRWARIANVFSRTKFRICCFFATTVNTNEVEAQEQFGQSSKMGTLPPPETR